MRKKVPVEELQLGMYIAELDRPWRETPFMFQGFEIRSHDDIEQLKRHCRFVYVDTPDTPSAGAPIRRPSMAPATTPQPGEPTRTSTTGTIHFDEYKLLKQVESPRFSGAYHDRTSLEEEISEIRQTHSQARAVVQTFMEDARLGRSIDGPGAKRVVGELVDSVLRNPDALTCFTQLKKRDEYTAMHSLHVCILALTFGRHLGLPPEELRILGIGAMLHDIGKMKMPLDVLNKPGELTENEFQLMKTHVPLGVDILEQISGIPQAAVQVARCHHERYSGGGYVNGYRGDQIGLYGMIGGIVDCYDAITSDRAYHTGLSAHLTLKEMYTWRGREFHAGLIEQFIQCMGIYPIGSVVALNTGEVGVVITMNRLRRLKPRVALVRKADGTSFGTSTVVDLMSCTTREGKPCEIECVLEPGVYGINPVDYLPVPAALIS
jgi:putative nucleotidyltransferase with HDIG domain